MPTMRIRRAVAAVLAAATLTACSNTTGEPGVTEGVAISANTATTSRPDDGSEVRDASTQACATIDTLAQAEWAAVKAAVEAGLSENVDENDMFDGWLRGRGSRC